MKKTIILFLFLAIGLASCTNNNPSSKETTEQEKTPNSNNPKEATNSSISYSVYTNPRFGFSILYPTFLSPEPEPENGDGRVFSNDNGEQICVFAQQNIMNYSIEELQQMCENSIDGTITYSAQKDNWFVLSGINSEDNIYYIKTILSNDIEYSVSLTYPQDKKQLYNEIVNEVTKSFKVGLEVTY